MSEETLAGGADALIAQTVADAIWDKKGFELVALEVTEIVGYTDLMVICSASSGRHASALANGVIEAMRLKFDRKPIGKEGDRGGLWVLLDYGEAVVHIFHAPVREYYELDRLYADAAHVPLQEPEWLAQAERERLYASTDDWENTAAPDPSAGDEPDDLADDAADDLADLDDEESATDPV